MFPDLHLKMSKKIAQLTKVIYHLNTRNEDFSIDLKLAKMISNFVFLVSIKYRNGIFATKFAKFQHVTQGGK